MVVVVVQRVWSDSAEGLHVVGGGTECGSAVSGSAEQRTLCARGLYLCPGESTLSSIPP